MYQLKLSPRADRELQKIPFNDIERVATALRQLRDNPRPSGIKKLKSGMYRVRTGNWRLIYNIFDREQKIWVLKIVRRSEDTYDKLAQLL